MKIVMILSSAAFIQLALCVDVSDGYKCVREQECAVASLSSKMTDLQKTSDAGEEKLAEVLEKYRDASKKTKKMIDTTIKLIDGAASVGGTNEVGDDDADNADMLYCSTMNAVKKILAINEKLRSYVQGNEKNKLEQDSNSLKELLK